MRAFYFLIQQSMMFAIPLLIVALGAMFTERSGVINVGMEGIMVMGAFCGTLFLHYAQGESGINGFPALLIALLIGTVAGIIFSAFHAFASVNMFADQTISGTALNLFASAFCIYVGRSLIGIQQVSFLNQFMIDKVPLLGDIPVLGPMLFQKAYFTTYLGIVILIVSSIVLNKTRFGLRLRSAGEFPQATDAAGISVSRTRWAGVLLSGALGGIGGVIYILPISLEFNADVAGYGFLAIAVMIFGQWKPRFIAMAAFFFGLLKALSSAYSGIPFLYALNIPIVLFQILPYIVTIVTLFLTSRKSAAPAAEGVPFDKGKR